MRKALGPLALAIVLGASALAPLASAHAAPDPLDNSVHVLADEAEDAFYWYDGYDLYNLFAREAYVETLDEPGIVLRFTLYGGFAPASTADELAIDVEATSPEGTQNLTITTADDEEWSGDLEVLVANVTEDEPPWTGVTARMQVFASYEQLGVAPGASLEDVRMVSRVDDEARDVAPGGVLLPHSQGRAEAPVGESQRLVDSLELEGPHGYVDAEARSTDDGLVIAVENTLANGQHVSVDLASTEGWNASVSGPAQASLPANETAEFPVDANVTPDAREPLGIEVVTDLGGHQTLFAGVNGSQLTAASTPDEVAVEPEEPEPNESPAPATPALVSITVALAWALRRR
jgi:hypothetical protein